MIPVRPPPPSHGWQKRRAEAEQHVQQLASKQQRAGHLPAGWTAHIDWYMQWDMPTRAATLPTETGTLHALLS